MFNLFHNLFVPHFLGGVGGLFGMAVGEFPNIEKL